MTAMHRNEDLALVVRTAAAVLCQTVEFVGGPALEQGSFDEKATRDLATITCHFVVNASSFKNHGRAMLGATDLEPMASHMKGTR